MRVELSVNSSGATPDSSVGVVFLSEQTFLEAYSVSSLSFSLLAPALPLRATGGNQVVLSVGALIASAATPTPSVRLVSAITSAVLAPIPVGELTPQLPAGVFGLDLQATWDAAARALSVVMPYDLRALANHTAAPWLVVSFNGGSNLHATGVQLPLDLAATPLVIGFAYVTTVEDLGWTCALLVLCFASG